MDQAVDDSNQPATGQYPNVTASEFRRSVECFAKAFHASPFVQTVTKFDTGRYLYVNDRFVSDAGYTREEVIGKTSIELGILADKPDRVRSEEHTSELQSQSNLVCRLLLEKKK